MNTAKTVLKWIGIGLLVLLVADVVATYVPLPAWAKSMLKSPLAFIKGLFGGGTPAA